MNTKLLIKKLQPVKTRWTLVILAVAALAVVAFETGKKHDLVVHEWGTFTSVQGGDGQLLSWHPLQTTVLPSFVYDWSKPGLNRQLASPAARTKGVMVTLQRMETPVIYFYSDTEQSVDVSVQFPKGLVTEWYPQAARIGPATFPPKPSLIAMDNAIHKVGMPAGFSFVSMFGKNPVTNSIIEWQNVRVLPAKNNQTLANQLHVEKTGNHYFAARETDSAFVSVDSRSKTNSADENEKFLFYRGVGNFATPLKVTTSADGKVTVENTGKEPLAHLFLLNVRDGNGAWSYLDKIEPGQKKEWRKSAPVKWYIFQRRKNFKVKLA